MNGDVVIEYHAHVGVRTAVEGQTVLMVCQHIYLDGAPCGFSWDARYVHTPGAGSRLTSAAAIRAYIARIAENVAYGVPASAAAHAPEVAGPDGFGYGHCVECRELWPCQTWRNK